MKTKIATAILVMAGTVGFTLGQETAIATNNRPKATGWATYYTVKSCQREGTSGLWTASGQRYDESALTCALPKATAKAWNMRFGAKLRARNLNNGNTVILTYTDRGPGKKAQRRGVIVDLTPAAFEALGGNLRDGKIKVAVDSEIDGGGGGSESPFSLLRWESKGRGKGVGRARRPETLH